MHPNLAALLTRFICESDAIENITDDVHEISRQIQHKKRRGHVGAMLLMCDLGRRKIPLTAAIVKQVQKLIVDEQPRKGQRTLAKRHCGEWRDCFVSVGGRLCPPPEHVDLGMTALIEEITAWLDTPAARTSDRDCVDFIARVHYKFLRIHPFVDGNGRSSRAIVFYLFCFVGIEPFIFTARDKHETYYRCFEDDGGNAMVEYFRKRACAPITTAY